MKFTIGKQELLKALGAVSGVLDKTQDTILSNIKLELLENELRLVASSSQNIWIQASFTEGLVIEEPGAICIKGHRLLSIAKVLQNPSVELLLENNQEYNTPQVSVTNGKANFKIAECKSAQEYPPIASFDLFTSITISNAELKRMIDETSFSIAAKERFNLNGIHFERIAHDDGGVLRMVSSDGTRLSLSETKYEGNLDPEVDEIFATTLFPERALVEVRKLCDQGDEDWTLSFGERECQFKKSGIEITIAMISGQFPTGYHDLVEGMNIPYKATINRKDLLDTCRKVSVFVARTTSAIRIDLEEDKLTVSIKNPDAGSFTESILIDYVGKRKSFNFNFNFLQDVLKAVDSELIEMNLGESENDPVLMTVPERDDCKFVVMPIRMS